MKVALIRRCFRPDGGGEQAFKNFVDAYMQLGHSVTILCEEWDDPDLAADKLSISAVSLRGSRSSRQSSFVRTVLEWTRNAEFDFTHSHEFIPGSNILRLGDGLHSTWLRYLKTKSAWPKRAYYHFDTFHNFKIKMQNEALQSTELRKVVCNSRFIRDEVCEYYPRLVDKVELVYNVVPESFFLKCGAEIKLPKQFFSSYRMVFVGSGWYRKNLVGALEVLKKLGREYSLTVIGRDSNEDFYKKLTQQMGLSEQVFFAGVIRVSFATLRNFDLLVNLSHYEPFPNAVSESLVCGIPVVSSLSSGAADFVNGQSVFVSDSSLEIANAIASGAVKAPNQSEVTGYRKIFSNNNLLKILQEKVIPN